MPNSKTNPKDINYSDPADIAAAAEAAIAAAIADVDMDAEAECKYRFAAQFVPNKLGGEAGRWLPMLITYDEDGEESNRETSYAFMPPEESKAIAACSAIWPDVVLPEGERVRATLEAALTRFLGSIGKRVAHEKQITRALVISKRDGVDINEALKMVEEADTNAIAEDAKASEKAAANKSKSKPDPAAEKCEDIFTD